MIPASNEKIIFEKTLKLSELPVLFQVIDTLIQNNKRIFLLQGDLASGKTTLISHYIQYAIGDQSVSSPTFSLMHQHGDFFHYDLYHHGLDQFIEYGFLENLDQGIHFIEWGDKNLSNILKNSRYNYSTIKIIKQENARHYRILTDEQAHCKKS